MSEIVINIEDCDGSEYVLFPACAYNGNKFNVLKKDYPPMFSPDEASVDMEVTITDIPRLDKDGSGKIQVTTGDVSVPCVGVYNQNTNKAVFVYTVQEIDGENLGLAYEKGRISITYPALRKEIYRAPRMYENNIPHFDKDAEIPYKTVEVSCNSIKKFYEIYFKNRKIMGLDSKRPEVISDEEQFEILKNKFNSMNWTGEYYDLDTHGQWQPGWCGGAISGYPLMKLGGELEKKRAIKTLEHLYNNQAPSGLFYGFNEKKGDGFDTKGTENWLFIRKSADALYFSFKHFELMENIPEKFEKGAKKLADLFVSIWEKYGQLGQFLDADTGNIIVGNSTAGAIVPAALVEAYKYFKDDRYVDTAMKCAEFMYNRDVLKGYTTGGPGEILQCPDSESAFALLDSMTALYELTGEDKWLRYAETTAHLASSWVVAYNYKFPEESEFGVLDMKTIGSVFANCQNKHSAPGICTLSGESINKLYSWTGNELYKELYEDITLTIGQYMSLDSRSIHSRDINPDLINDDTVKDKRIVLPQGFINERVNMSDWEGTECVGTVFNGSCWCETSNLLVLSERIIKVTKVY